MADWDVVSTAPVAAAAPSQPTGPVDRSVIVNYWKGKSLPDHVAEGIADALHSESGGNPIAVNMQSGATGLAQDLGPRKAQLQAQPNWQNPQVQLDNMYREVTGGDKIASDHWKEIQAAPTRESARDLWEKYFERPGSPAKNAGDWEVTAAPGWRVSPSAISSEQDSGADVRYMTPADYLAMTPDIGDGAGQTAKAKSLAKSLAAGDDIEAIPTLDVKRQGDKLVVYDQDGRNRALAAQQAGVDLIPVAIKGAGSGDAPAQIQGMTGTVRPFDWKPVGATTTEKPGRSFLKGVGEGLLDPVYGAAQLASRLAPTGVVEAAQAIEAPLDRLASAVGLPGAQPPSAPPASMSAIIKQREAEIAASRGPEAGFDWARAGGNVVSGAALAAVAPEMLGGSSLGAMAAGGAAQGALAPVTNPGDSFTAQKLGQIGMGAVAGPLTALGGRAIAQAVGPAFRPAVQQLLNEGVRLTPGQMSGGVGRWLENAASSIPVLGSGVRTGQRRSIEDLNRAAWNRVLAPLGKVLPAAVQIGRDAAQFVHDQVQQAYDAVIPHLTGYADAPFVRALADVGVRAQRDLPDAQWGTFRRILSAQLVQKASAPADGAALKGIDSELSREAAGYKSDPSFDNRKMGQYLDEVHVAFRSALERQNPKFAPALKAANEAYANEVRVSRAAASQGAAKDEGVFTAAQLGAAVRASDRSMRKGQFARGGALLQDLSDAAQNVLPSNVPNSGTPERLALMGVLGGAAHLEPLSLAASLTAATPYTSPGMSALRRWAIAFPQVRQMLARPIRVGGNLLAPGAALAASAAAGR